MTWLGQQAARLAAELIDELDGINLDRGWTLVELRVVFTEPADRNPNVEPAVRTEYVRRVRSDFGEWAGTERESSERFEAL